LRLKVQELEVVDIGSEEAYPRERRGATTCTFNANFSLR
jgi:hypothetical protein